jgi:mono/diheme cytochrome c family protein
VPNNQPHNEILMMMNKLPQRLDGRKWAVFIFIILIFSLGYLGADAQEPSLPLTPPNAEIGLEIFADRCANCHGPTGGGDGELSANLPKQPAKLNDPEFRKTAVPGTIFGHITNGIIESGMPPFGPASTNPISEENRWDLIAAIYSLSTPADTLAAGQTIYEESCLACHGDAGAGDGPDAAANVAGLDLTRLSYWFNRSNDTVLADLPGGIADHEFTLNDDEQLAVVDYARTFSYAYFNPTAPLEPIEDAVISGQVTNGTSDEPVGGSEARLRAFTTSFQETLNLTTTVGIDGRFHFDLPTVDPDWVYLASVRYNDLSFSSNAGQISRSELALELPIVVYETTTNPAAIMIDQVHLIMDFQGDLLQVSEIYIISNREAAVFVGEQGDPNLGTVQFSLPDGAESPSFERTLSSMESTIPATEIIQTEQGWADTLPMQPGSDGMNLIVSYLLPYKDGMTLTHPLYYGTSSANIILPDVGVSVTGSGWEFRGSNVMPGGGGNFLSYGRSNIPSGENLTMVLEGKPERQASVGGNNALASRNTSNELIIGGGILLVAVVTVGFFFRSWQSPPLQMAEFNDDDYDEADEEDDEINQLLQAIADLDDAHERGELEEADYANRRYQLKEQLISLWP